MLKSDDKNIIFRINQGDLVAFEHIFRKHYENLCRYAMKILNNADEAEEVVQDLFLVLWQKRETIKIDVSLKAYLYIAVHNRCLKLLRRKNIEEKFRNSQSKTVVYSESPEETANTGEMFEIFERTMDSLPARCSAIFRMSRFEGLKYAEIARKLSVSVKTVEANMGKALKMLRKNLKDYTEVA